MNPTDIQALVDNAAKQSDRWMFVALLFILVGGLIYDKIRQEKVVRVLFDELRSDRKDTDSVIDANTVIHTRVLEKLNQIQTR